MKLSLIAVFLSGCLGSLSTQNEFYHHFNAKPVSTETTIGHRKHVTIHNPLEVDIDVVMDCDEELNRRHNNIKANESVSFELNSHLTSQSCVIEQWTVIK